MEDTSDREDETELADDSDCTSGYGLYALYANVGRRWYEKYESWIILVVVGYRSSLDASFDWQETEQNAIFYNNKRLTHCFLYWIWIYIISKSLFTI